MGYRHRTAPPTPSPHAPHPNHRNPANFTVDLAICDGTPNHANVSPAPHGARQRERRCDADVAQLVAHHLAKVRVAGSSPVIRSAVPRTRLAQRESASLTRKRSLVQSQYRVPPTAGPHTGPAVFFLSRRPRAPPSESMARGTADPSPTAHKTQVTPRIRGLIWISGGGCSNVLSRNAASESPPTRCGCSAAGSASPCQGEGRGFESRHPLGFSPERHHLV